MPDLLDDPEIAAELERGADAAMARVLLRSALEAQPHFADVLIGDPAVREAAFAVAAVSRSLGRAFAHDPRALDAVRAVDGLDHERTVDDLQASWRAALERDPDAASDDADPPDAATRLRRWKRREITRIAARDLTGRSDLPCVGRELAGLAEVCLGAALGIAAPTQPIAIIGMGKLGGAELNYSSDVDVIFVHEDSADRAASVARTVLSVMGGSSPDGIVFRTDADLRPEGRAGPLSRSLNSTVAYYEHHADAWEFQALLKARPVAGDRDLGARFRTAIEPLVWPETLDPDAVRSVRAMKRRTEAMMRSKGLGDRDLKRAPGGIRDIEFAVQLLQLVHGRHDHSLRSCTTLAALAALADGDYVEADDAAFLDRAYRDLRTFEHRLQLQEEQQTHAVPEDDGERARLARACGFRDRGDRRALAQFDAHLRQLRATVRTTHERIYFEPLLETIAGTGHLSVEAAEERLSAFGFRDAPRARTALRQLASGLTRRSRLMQELLPALLGWLSETPDPDLGLLQLQRLTEGPARSAAVAHRFRESAIAAERTCRLVGSSRLAGDALLRQPDFLAELGDDAQLRTRTRDELVDEATGALEWRVLDTDARREGLRRFKRRHLLRIASRDLLGLADTDEVQRELSWLADAAVQAALTTLVRVARSEEREAPPFAVIGMGRLGGEELSYASDIDVMFVYDGRGAEAFDHAERVATRLMRDIGDPTVEGRLWEIDAKLRPEGKAGTLVRSLEGYRKYYEQRALTWEFQSLTRARVIAGDPEVGTRFLELIEPFVYRADFPEAEAREVRRIKARVERERIPPGEDPQFHLKLGKGSLVDIEFTVQLLQLQHGGREPTIRVASTMLALERLASVGVLTAEDGEDLAASYRFCERARNARYLLTGQPGDFLPVAPDEGERLARLLGYGPRPGTAMREDYKRLTRRARGVVERVFYGQAG